MSESEWIEEHHGQVIATIAGEGDGPKGTVYICPTGVWRSGDVSGSLLLDNGEVPWGHMSSSMGWLIRDLTNGFGDRRDRLVALYPNGCDVVLAVKDEDVPAEVMERNRVWGESQKDVTRGEASAEAQS